MKFPQAFSSICNMLGLLAMAVTLPLTSFAQVYGVDWNAGARKAGVLRNFKVIAIAEEVGGYCTAISQLSTPCDVVRLAALGVAGAAALGTLLQARGELGLRDLFSIEIDGSSLM